MDPKKVWDFADAIEVAKKYHETEVEEKDTEIGKLGNVIGGKDDQIKDLEAEINTANSTIMDLEKKIADLEKDLENAKDRIE